MFTVKNRRAQTEQRGGTRRWWLEHVTAAPLIVARSGCGVVILITPGSSATQKNSSLIRAEHVKKH